MSKVLTAVFGSQAFWCTLIGIAVGGAITFFVSRYYYKKGAAALRWEARAAPVRPQALELLVAYNAWDDHIKPGQAIDLGGENVAQLGTFYFKHFKTLLAGAGLGHIHIRAYGVPKGSTRKAPPSEKFFDLTEEGKQLAAYLLRTRGYPRRVVRLWKTSPDEKFLVELLWSADARDTLGPVKVPEHVGSGSGTPVAPLESATGKMNAVGRPSASAPAKEQGDHPGKADER